MNRVDAGTGPVPGPEAGYDDKGLRNIISE